MERRLLLPTTTTRRTCATDGIVGHPKRSHCHWCCVPAWLLSVASLQWAGRSPRNNTLLSLGTAGRWLWIWHSSSSFVASSRRDSRRREARNWTCHYCLGDGIGSGSGGGFLMLIVEVRAATTSTAAG